MRTRQAAGAKAKRVGEAFEQYCLINAGREKITLIKIPDGARRVQGAFGVKLLPVKTPFDFVMACEGECGVFDCKTFDKNNLTYSDIVPHQLQYLTRCSYDFSFSGYLVWFRPMNQVVFFSAIQMQGLLPRQSLAPSVGLALGPGDGFSLKKLFALNALPGKA